MKCSAASLLIAAGLLVPYALTVDDYFGLISNMFVAVSFICKSIEDKK